MGLSLSHSRGAPPAVGVVAGLHPKRPRSGVRVRLPETLGRGLRPRPRRLQLHPQPGPSGRCLHPGLRWALGPSRPGGFSGSPGVSQGGRHAALGLVWARLGPWDLRAPEGRGEGQCWEAHEGGRRSQGRGRPAEQGRCPPGAGGSRRHGGLVALQGPHEGTGRPRGLLLFSFR